MHDKSINKRIRIISTTSSLILLIITVVMLAGKFFLKYLVIESGYGSFWQNDDYVSAVSVICIYLIIIPLLLLLYYKRLNLSIRFRPIFTKPQRSKGWIFKWALIAIGCSVVVNYLLSFPLKFFGVLGDGSFIKFCDDRTGYIIYFVTMIFLAPFFEELFFRATIFRGMNDLGVVYASVITGLMFGLWHMNIDQIIHASTFGFFACLIFAKSRSIFVVVIIHSFNNLLVFLNLYSRSQLIKLISILSSKDSEFALHALFFDNTGITIMFVLSLLLIIGIAVAGSILAIIELIKRKGKSGFEKTFIPYNLLQRTLIFFSSPVTVLCFGFMIFGTLTNVIVIEPVI